jgi:hypothetical protein
MKEYKKSLKKAKESEMTELIFSVILEMKEREELNKLYNLIKDPEFKIAKDLLISYYKFHDIGFLKIFLRSLELPNEAAYMYFLFFIF